jgi:hypothetical protein
MAIKVSRNGLLKTEKFKATWQYKIMSREAACTSDQIVSTSQGIVCNQGEHKQSTLCYGRSDAAKSLNLSFQGFWRDDSLCLQ